jgi:hypothetical protein
MTNKEFVIFVTNIKDYIFLSSQILEISKKIQKSLITPIIE